MDLQLAQEDMEMLAAAQQLADMSKEAGIDVNGLSDDQVIELVKMATDAVGTPDQTESVEHITADGEMERIAQADFTGRVIARSMMDELQQAGVTPNMLKTASPEARPMKTINSAVSSWLTTPVQDRMEKVAAVNDALRNL